MTGKALNRFEVLGYQESNTVIVCGSAVGSANDAATACEDSHGSDPEGEDFVFAIESVDPESDARWIHVNGDYTFDGSVSKFENCIALGSSAGSNSSVLPIDFGNTVDGIRLYGIQRSEFFEPPTDESIAASYNSEVAQVSSGEITAGTETELRTYSPKDVADIAGLHGSGGGGGSGTVTSVGITASDGLEVDSGSPVTTSGNIVIGVDATALLSHLGVESGATADQSIAEIAAAYASQVEQISSGEITAGTETALRTFSPKDVADIAAEHGGGGGGGGGSYVTQISGAFVLYTNQRWVTPSNLSEGWGEPNWNTNAGTGSTPSIDFRMFGFIVPTGRTIANLHMITNHTDGTPDDLDLYIVFVTINSGWGTDAAANGDVTSTVLYNDRYLGSGSPDDLNNTVSRTIALDYDTTETGHVLIFVRGNDAPASSVSMTTTLAIEVE